MSSKDSKPLQQETFNFDTLRENLNKMEQDIVRALQFLDIDERNISASTLEITTDLKGHSTYYEAKRLEKRKQIEEKFKKLEAQREDEVRNALKNRRTFHSDHSNMSEVRAESAKKVGERMKSNAKLQDSQENLEHNNSELIDKLDEINKDLGIDLQDSKVNDTEGDQMYESQRKDDKNSEMMMTGKSFNEEDLKGKDLGQSGLNAQSGQKKTGLK